MAFLALTLVLSQGCMSSDALGFDPDDQTLTNAETFAEYLRDSGLQLEGPEYNGTANSAEVVLSGPILTYQASSDARSLGGEISVVRIYPFIDEESAKISVFPVSGGTGQTGPPRVRKWTYQNGRIIVVYRGENSTVRGVLQRALGRAKRR